MPRLAIIGLGLIGGSLGLALKRAQIEGLEVAGHDAEWGVAGRARKLGAIDREERHAAAAAEGAALIIIATPILQVRKVLEEIAPALSEGAVVTDTASTKRDVMRWANQLLPAEASFVGGHPIAGKEQPGLDGADASLFEGRPWAVIPSVHASEQAISTVENLVGLAGARPVLIDAAEHDSYLAAVSHLPLVVAAALFSLTSGTHAWPELAALAGPGFRDITRLASSSPDLSHDICLTNRENLLHWLDRFVEELRRYRHLIEDSGAQEALFKAFAKVQATRDAFLEAPPAKPAPTREAESISAGERTLSLLLGEYVVRRRKEMEQLLERRIAGDGERSRGGKVS